MKKVLIIGSTGLLGSEFKDFYIKKKEIDVFLSSRSSASLSLDIGDNNSVIDFFKENSFDIVINCAATTNVVYCEENKHECYKTNSKGAINIVEALNRASPSTLLIHISSDYVLPSSSSVQAPGSKTAPLNFYGYTKLLAEDVIGAFYQNYIIVRPTILMGNYPGNLIHKILNSREVALDNKRPKFPLFVNDLVRYVDMLISKNIKNKIVHCSTCREMTKYEIGMKVCEVFNHTCSILEKDDPALPPRPFRVLMGKNEQDFKCLSIEESLESLKEVLNENI